jgi:tRNA A-37 threonylcarbamoyl transferase component Bud32
MLEGVRLGAYQLIKLVGQGATASVFEGQHVALGKRVAVKVLHEHLLKDDQIAARFLREGRVAAQLHHDHVLEVLDLGQDGDLVWLVMELLEGHDLRTELERTGPLSLEDAVAHLLPIASALAYAHRQGAVHRDIKPANVFLGHDERGRIVPKVVDFGLSKLMGLDDERPLTESEIVAGSVAYMAPEQTYGIARAGPAADQFSFAAVLYECVTGHAPFRARTFYELIERIRASHASPPSVERPGLPPAFDAVVLRALAAEPGERWPSMRALGVELLAFADASTAEAWSADFVEQPARAGKLVASPRRLRAAPVARRVEGGGSEPGCPPLPRPAGTSPFQIKGLPYRGLSRFIGRVLPGGLDELVDALEEPSLRTFVRQPFLASSRYDVLPIRPLLAVLARLLGRPFIELTRETAAAQARYDARTVFRQMFGGATLDDWHERATRFGAQYYTFGRFEGKREGPGVALTIHEGVPEYLAPWYGPMQAAYAEETIRVLGGKNVKGEALPWHRSGELDGLVLVTTCTRTRWDAPGH